MSAISTLLPAPPNGFSTTLSSSISSAALTIPLNSVVGLGTEGVGVLFKKGTDGSVTAGSIEYIHWTGISGNSLTLSDTGDRGLTGSSVAAQAYANGDYFEVWVSSYYYNSFKNAVDTDGTLSGNSDIKLASQKAVKTYADLITTTQDAKNAGWIPATGTWSATDANTISIAGLNLTGSFQLGDKIKVTNNSAVKYFYISTAPAFSTNTTFDVSGEVDLVAGAITLPYYSKLDNPQGFKKGEIWYKATANGSGSQVLSDATPTKMQLSTKSIDPNSNFDAVTNYRWTCPVTGDYLMNGKVQLIDAQNVIVSTAIYIYKNGSSALSSSSNPTTAYNGNIHSNSINYILKLTKGDYIELFAYCDVSDAGTSVVDQSNISIQFISI